MAEKTLYEETYVVYSPWSGGDTKSITVAYDATEDVVNEFTFTTDADWITLSEPEFYSYTKDTNGAVVCMVNFKWSVGTNAGDDRVGTISIDRNNDYNSYLINIQVTQYGGVLSVDEIPEDAYKEIIPGVTPWVTTFTSPDFPEYSIGRAEKVIYEPNNFLRNPDIRLFIPGVTEHTRAHLIKIFPEFDVDALNFKNFYAGVNPYIDWSAKIESTEYPGFRSASGAGGIGVSSTESFGGYGTGAKGVSYKNIKLIFYIENYDNQIGNYIAIPVQYVLCREGLIKEEFDKIVEIFGPANYDGTMHDLHKFDFTPKEITPKSTPWVSTRRTGGLSMTDAGTIKYYEDKTYGRAERVLYCTCDDMTPVEASIFVPGKCDETRVEYYIDADNCVNMEDPENDLWMWDNSKDNGWFDMPIEQTGSSTTKHYGVSFVPSSNFLPDHIGLPTYQKNHRSTVINFVVHDYNRQSYDYFEGNAIVIPFRIVQCMSGITKAEFDELVEIYGASNYDGTMNDLTPFGFEATDTDTDTDSDNTTEETLVVPEGKFTSDSITISADGGMFWTRFDITNMTYDYYTNLISSKGENHSDEIMYNNEKIYSDENEWIYAGLSIGTDNVHVKKDRTTGKAYLYIKYSVKPNTTNYDLTSYLIYKYWGTIKGAAQINADPLYECKIPVYQLPASDTTTKTEKLPDKPVGIDDETLVGAPECGYTNTLDVFTISEEDIQAKLKVYSTADWLKITNITYNKN